MKDNVIIALLVMLIVVFILIFHNAQIYVDHAVAQGMETYLNLQGYDVTE